MTAKTTDLETETRKVESDAVSRVEGIRFNNSTQQGITNYYEEWTGSYDKDMLSIKFNGQRYTAEGLAKAITGNRHAVKILVVASGTGLVDEEDMLSIKFNGQRYTAEGLAKVITGNRHAVKILDVASGTGLVGEELVKLGFSNIDALEPSAKSLEQAKAKKIYTNCLCTLIDEKQLDIANDTYDGVTVCGATVEGHLPAVGLYEILRVLKPGGFFCLVGNTKCFDSLEEYNVRMRGIMTTLAEEGQWKKLSEEILEGYYVMKTRENCYRFIYQKT